MSKYVQVAATAVLAFCGSIAVPVVLSMSLSASADISVLCMVLLFVPAAAAGLKAGAVFAPHWIRSGAAAAVLCFLLSAGTAMLLSTRLMTATVLLFLSGAALAASWPAALLGTGFAMAKRRLAEEKALDNM